MIQLLNSFISRVFNKILYLFGFLKNRWCLAIVDKKFKIKKIIVPPKNFFWADPFFIKFKNKNYVFFESYSYLRKKGEIACGELKNNQIVNFRIIMKKKYHLSYPFIFKYKNNIFLMPETYQKKNIKIYKSIKFPFKWKLYSSALKNLPTVDPTIIKIKKNFWLFANHMKENISDFNKNLYLYKLNNLKFKNLKPHLKNPIITSINGGRSAGSIFKIGKKLIRPSQINKENFYGYGLKLSIIKKISLNNYKEKEIKRILPTDKNIAGIHHLSKIDDKNYLVDVCLKYSKNN